MSDRSLPKTGERNARPTKVVGKLLPPKKTRGVIVAVTPAGVPVRVHGISDLELRKMKIEVRKRGLHRGILRHPESSAFQSVLQKVRRDISQKHDNRIKRPGSAQRFQEEETLLMEESV